jgi:ABC-type antimicrobial peptide transport system permease subunit
VVGILEGKSLVSFSSLEYWMQRYKARDPYSYGIIILPKKGASAKLSSQLQYLPYQGLDIRTLDSIKRENTESSSGAKLLLNLINLTVIAIVTICTGFLCYIYFYQRRTEFGILNAIGYTRRQIISKAFIEVGGMSTVGLAAGLLVSLLVCILINRWVLIPKGQLLRLWNPECLLSTLCIPLFVTVFSTFPVWRMLNRLDPVAIIEGY